MAIVKRAVMPDVAIADAAVMAVAAPSPIKIRNSAEAERLFGSGSSPHIFMFNQERVRVRLDIKTVNPMNGGTGNTRKAGIIKSRRRAKERALSFQLVSAALRSTPMCKLPVDIWITRVSPGRGLDPMDSLGAAMKAVVDGIADAFGCKDDRDERLGWQLPFKNRKGRKGEYAVEIEIRARVE